MKILRLMLCVAAAIFLPSLAFGDLVGPYAADANTLFLLHFDEAAGGSVTTNVGSKGGNFYTVSEATASTTPPVVTTMLGAPSYVNGATNFHNCLTNPTTGYLAGYDFNNSGAYQGGTSSSSLSADALAMTNLNIGNGGQSPFTIEAVISPTTISVNQEIVCTDSDAGSRGFQFRITAGTLQFQFITGSQAVSGTIPTTGADAFVAGGWYHVAVVYNGSVATLYWTKLDPANGAAHVLSSANLTLGTTQGAVTGPLCISGENRNVNGEYFQGSIDEVRISSVARAANQMQFYSPAVTIAQNPVSQNVDYNQPVTFSVGASSLTALGYQWRFNSNTLANATNSSYVITNVAAGNAGYYDCIVTNTAGYSATSSVARLVVGAANFLADRYSFTTDTSDSIGGQWGTNFGTATVTGGKLVLDGTTGTYMQLPGNLFNSANATALTVEWWATYGSNPNNVYAFSFGTTNFVIGQGIIGFNFATYSPHNSTGQTASSSPGDPIFAQSVSASGNLDGRNVHVAVVFDPPNKVLSIYTNGILEAVNTNFTVPLANLNDQLSFIGRSLWASDPYLNASIDELRIFKGALSSISIKQSQDQGPDTLLADGPAQFVTQPVNTTVPAGQTATLTAAAVGYLPITYRWYKNGSPLPGATNASYSFTALIGDNNSTFVCYATNTIGVTTYSAASSTATVTVFIPPTDAWIDANNGGSGDGQWNTTSLNWTNDGGAGPIVFSQTNGVLFDVRGSASPNVEVTQAIIPYDVKVDSASDYTLQSSSATGSLNGQGTIHKVNSGKLTLDLTNNLSGAVTISGGTLQIGNNDANGSLGSGVVTNNATLSIARSDTALNVGNTIHGSGILSFDGSGAVTLSGNNDYTGATTLNSGIVFLTSSNGLGDIASGTTVANAAQLYVTANVNLNEPLTLSGAGDGNGALRKGGAGLTVDTGTVALLADSTIGIDTGATLTLSNVVFGTAGLTANGNGTLSLAVNNTFSGGFTLNGPIVNVNTPGALGTGPVLVGGTGRFVLGTGMTFTNAITANTVSPGAVTGLIMVNDNTNGTITTVTGPLTFNATAANGGNFFGPVSSGRLDVTSSITNTATGIVSSRLGFVRFSGGGNYIGFNINEGTVSLGANNGLCPSGLSLGSSGTAIFDLNGFNQDLLGLSDGGANGKMITNSAATLKTLTMNLTLGNTYSGSIGGKLALVVNGSGSLLLSGTNHYSGNTTVNGGTLELAAASFDSSSTVSIASGAVLQLDAATTNVVAGLVLNGVSQPSGYYDATSGSPYLAGAGTLHVVTVNSTPTNIVTSVSGNQLTLSWPADHTGWRLQVQTNSLTSGLGTNWIDVPGSTTVNSMPFTINPTNGSVFFRMVYP